MPEIDFFTGDLSPLQHLRRVLRHSRRVPVERRVLVHAILLQVLKRAPGENCPAAGEKLCLHIPPAQRFQNFCRLPACEHRMADHPARRQIIDQRAAAENGVPHSLQVPGIQIRPDLSQRSSGTKGNDFAFFRCPAHCLAGLRQNFLRRVEQCPIHIKRDQRILRFHVVSLCLFSRRLKVYYCTPSCRVL